MSSSGAKLIEDAMEQGAEDARGDVAGGFVDRHDAAGVQGGVVAVFLAEQISNSGCMMRRSPE